MALQTSHNVDLSSRAIKKFVCSSKDRLYKEITPIPSGYVLSEAADRSSGKIEKDNAGKELSVFCFYREYYDVIEGSKSGATGTVVSNISADIHVKQDVFIEIFSRLIIKDGLDQSRIKKINEAYTNYPARGSTTPDDYMSEFIRTNTDISASMFRVTAYYVIYKIGDAVPYTQDRDAKLSIYNGNIDGTVWDESGASNSVHGENGYFRQRNMEVRLVDTKMLDQFPANQKSDYEVEVQDSEVYNLFDKIINSEAETVGCSAQYYEIKNHRIATLIRIPEFKLEFKEFSIEIGCGITISVTLPVLQIRWSNLDLYAIVRFPNNLGQLVVDSVVDCAWKAALAGAVIGVAFGNFAAAVIAFKSLFTDCLKNKFKQFILCMIPNLGLNTSVTEDWASV